MRENFGTAFAQCGTVVTIKLSFGEFLWHLDACILLNFFFLVFVRTYNLIWARVFFFDRHIKFISIENVIRILLQRKVLFWSAGRVG